MTKAKPNIATKPASLKFTEATPTKGLSIADAHAEAQLLGNESETLDVALFHRDDDAGKTQECEEQKLYNFYRTEGLLAMIETTLARDAAEALVQLDRIECRVQEMYMDAGSEIERRSFYHVKLMIESVARVLADLGGVDRAKLSWCGGILRTEMRGYIPHSRVAA